MADLNASKLVGPGPMGAVRTVSLAVKRYLDRYAPEGLVLGVSGGADSLSLAVAAVDLAQRRSIPNLAVVVDHGIRKESALEAQGVADLLGRLGAGEVVVATPAHTASGEGPEAQARSRRYAELLAQADSFAGRHKLDSTDVLLGHTMDDQAETVLLGLARGSGMRSLRGMARRQASQNRSHSIGRPLLGIRRTDTEAFCAMLGLPTVDDPTNRPDSGWRTALGEPLRRAAVRAWALPELARSLGQDPVPALARTARQLREDNEALDWMAERWLEQATLNAGPGFRSVTVTDVKTVPGAVRRRVWRLLALGARASAGEVADGHLRDIDQLATDWRGRGPVQLPGNIQVIRRGEQLVFSARDAGGE